MAELTPTQVVAALALAGWPKDQWATGAAIAMAESTNNPTAVNPQSGAAGLWQILPSAHQDLFKKLPKPDDWKDPFVNAFMALQVWKGRGSKWDVGGWATYGGHVYNQALPAAQAAASQLSQQLEQAGSTTAQHQILGDILKPVDPLVAQAMALAGAGQDVLKGIAGGASTLGGVISATGPAVASSVFQWPAEITSFFSTAADDLGKLGGFFSNLFNPATYVRTGAGLIGIIFLIMGIIGLFMASKAKD